MGKTFSVGGVEVLCFTDAETEFPSPLQSLFPQASDEDWQAIQARYPDVFATPASWKVHFGCHLIRSGQNVILVDTGIGPDPSQFLGGRPGRLFDD